MRRWLRSDMLVLRWVFLGLYAAAIVALFIFIIYNPEPVLFILLGVFLASQALFILGSGTIHLCRPIRRRRLILPVIVASAMLSLLLGGFIMAMIEVVNWKDAPDWVGIVFLIVLGVSWIGWGVLLFLHVRDVPRYNAMTRLTTYLFAGSLAELIATVPSHIIVSRRPGCFVGMLTMMGIIAGGSVMLFSFGPAIVLLFLRPRHRAEHAEAAYPLCPQCGYDLRASIDRCPECGLTIAPQRIPQ